MLDKVSQANSSPCLEAGPAQPHTHTRKKNIHCLVGEKNVPPHFSWMSSVFTSIRVLLKCHDVLHSNPLSGLEKTKKIL